MYGKRNEARILVDTSSSYRSDLVRLSAENCQIRGSGAGVYIGKSSMRVVDIIESKNQ